MPSNPIHAEYEAVKLLTSADCKSNQNGAAILHLVETSLAFLNTRCQPVTLKSRVPKKEYFSFSQNGVVARPANIALFIRDVGEIRDLWARWERNALSVEDFGRLSYTVALSTCLAMEIFDRQNKKGPATYFECYIGHLFGKALNVNPTHRARLPVAGREVLMTMDFIFDIGGQHKKVHVPVKMSTRERVVQAWAHQRMLDAAYGDDAYRGVMVLFSETKLDSRSLEVIEICVPDQWLAYQGLLSKMDRIYYFDMPNKYQELTDAFPQTISIKPFGHFFAEKAAVLYSTGHLS